MWIVILEVGFVMTKNDFRVEGVQNKITNFVKPHDYSVPPCGNTQAITQSDTENTRSFTKSGTAFFFSSNSVFNTLSYFEKGVV